MIDLVSLALKLPAPRMRADAFCVEAFIAGHTDVDAVLTQRPTFERLRRKVEVTRRLHVFYDRDLRKPLHEGAVAAGYAKLLCAQFITIADRARDWPCLNAALKMQDSILTAPAFEADRALADESNRLLEFVAIPVA